MELLVEEDLDIIKALTRENRKKISPRDEFVAGFFSDKQLFSRKGDTNETM